MKPHVDDSHVAQVAILVKWLVSLTLLSAAIYLIYVGKIYKASAAMGGLALIWLIILLTRRIFPGHQRLFLQIPVCLVAWESILFGTILDFYLKYSFFDKLNHGLAGALFAGVGLVTFYWINPEQRVHLTVRPGFVAFYCVGFAIVGKLLWEFYEFSGDRILNANMQRWQFGAVYALTDTMLDLAVGLTGSLIVSLIFSRKMRQDSQVFYQRYISGFFHDQT